jgi:hypothetical protein
MAESIERMVSLLVERVMRVPDGEWASRNWRLGLQVIDDCGGESIEFDAVADFIGLLLDLIEGNGVEYGALAFLCLRKMYDKAASNEECAELLRLYCKDGAAFWRAANGTFERE